MTNMTQASATERKGASDLLRFKIFGMPLPLYAFALITLLLSHFYNAIPTDLVGGFALMFVMGAILVKSANVYRSSINILAAHRL